MILVIDNYDSFVHNLARLVRLTGQETIVLRNDATDTAAIAAMQPDAIVLSPGPGRPEDAGCCIEIVRRLRSIPILGVCLGHQAIVEALGGTVGLAPEPMHGHTSVIEHSGENVFAEIPSPLTVCRYHSLAAQRESLPPDLLVTAQTTEGIVMAVAHKTMPTYGVQFHPEAVLTERGQSLVDNFVRLARESAI